MAGEPLTLEMLVRFHREVLRPEAQADLREAREDQERRFADHLDAIYQRFGRLESEYHMVVSGLRRLEDRVERGLADVGGEVAGLGVRMAGVENRLSGVEEELSGVKHRLTGVEGRLTGVEGRLTGIEGRLTGVEDRLTALDGRQVSD